VEVVPHLEREQRQRQRDRADLEGDRGPVLAVAPVEERGQREGDERHAIAEEDPVEDGRPPTS